jgi:hypothetical protein
VEKFSGLLKYPAHGAIALTEIVMNGGNGGRRL